MKNLNIAALSKSLSGTLLLLYVVLAFGGLVSQHYLPLGWHIAFAITEAVLLTVIFYCEETDYVAPAPTEQHLAQLKYGWGQ